MYGIVLATALTAGSASPEFFFRGCHGCCGCYGCYGCCGCYGCYGCHGCYGCCGCYGGCCGCYGGCCGCYGGCWGYYAPVVKVYPSYYYGGCCGCCGSYGGYMTTPVITAPAKTTKDPAPKSMPKSVEDDSETGVTRMPATVMVKAPADVKITVNGHATSRRSTEETFLTPHLPVGKTFAYVFSAEVMRDGEKITKTERITVRAGEKSEVDFSNLDRSALLTDVAHLTVKLPENARLFVNDVAVSATGTQTFETPKLQKGRKFFYTVKAEVQREGKMVTESQRVSVEAGKTITVDFVKAKNTLTASR